MTRVYILTRNISSVLSRFRRRNGSRYGGRLSEEAGRVFSGERVAVHYAFSVLLSETFKTNPVSARAGERSGLAMCGFVSPRIEDDSGTDTGPVRLVVESPLAGDLSLR